MKPTCLLTVLGLLAAAQCCGAGRILAFLPFPIKSHMISFTALTRGLAERGHEITLVSALPQEKNHPNQKVIAIGVSPVVDQVLNTSQILHEEGSNGFFNKLSHLWEASMFGSIVGGYALEHPLVQEVFNKPIGYYDALVLEPFFFQESLLALRDKFKVPVIALHSHGDIIDVNYVIGASVWTSFKPHPYMDFSAEMGLFERAQNSLFSLCHLFIKWFSNYPAHQQLLDKHFPGSRPVSELVFTNVDLTIFNSHHTLCYSGPFAPNTVFAGGMHINHNPKPISEKLLQFMDDAKDGIVYFSMGTLLKASDMTDDQKTGFLEAFRSLKQRVIMKWNAEPPANLPENVFLQEWMPQDQILGHPNTRVFITHGGLLSTQEAVYYGIPVIGIPRFADQKFNLQLARRKGYGLELNMEELTKENIEWSIKEIINNPKYYRAAKKLSELFRDQPIKPLDNAIFWTEHVIKHGGEHLRPSSLNLSWYQVILLDLLMILLTPILVSLIVISLICRKRRKNKGKSTSRKQKTN